MPETQLVRSRLEAAVNNIGLVAISRFLMPILISAIGFLVWTSLVDVKTSVEKTQSDLRRGIDQTQNKIEDVRQSFWNAQSAMARIQNDMSVKIGILGEKVDNQGHRLDRLETATSSGVKP